MKNAGSCSKTQGTMYEGYFVLTVTWLPADAGSKKFVELMFDDDAIKPNSKAQTLGMIEAFKRMRQHRVPFVIGTGHDSPEMPPVRDRRRPNNHA